jgi:dTDP-4-amino-4,6-dideoxygalactose transaminase
MSKLAVVGGEPVRSKPWPHWPEAREGDVEAVAEVVRSGRWWYWEGTEGRQFEQEFAEYQEARHAVILNSGTSALEVALEAMGVGPGDEVIVPAYTFQATATCVLLANAVPVFADIEPDTLNIAPRSVAEAITERTRAVVPVHFAGLPADLDALREVVGPHNIRVLEDAAHAHGAVWRGRKLGALGEAGAFSFQASKNLSGGEGGAILTNDDELAARAAGLRDIGRVRGRPFYEHHFIGYNFRMTEMQSALLRSRLRWLEEETERRWRNGRRLSEKLSALPGIEPIDPEPGEGDRRAYHVYPIQYRPEVFDGLSRERFMEAVQAEGVSCGAGYERPLYDNPIFRERDFRPRGCPVECPHCARVVDYRDTYCPVAEEMSAQLIMLFHNVLLGSDEDTDDIARVFEKVVEEHRSLLAREMRA